MQLQGLQVKDRHCHYIILTKTVTGPKEDPYCPQHAQAVQGTGAQRLCTADALSRGCSVAVCIRYAAAGGVKNVKNAGACLDQDAISDAQLQAFV